MPITHIVAASILCSAIASKSSSTKRGLVGSTCNRTKLFAPHARNWMYNYGVNLDNWNNKDWETDDCQSFAARSGFEFVPMVSKLDNLVSSDDHVYVGAQRLLGMNEPSDSKNESALLSAQRWKEYEAIADKFDTPLLLGSAAPGGLKLDRGMTWLRDFFSGCGDLYGDEGCRVDFVAVHFYECNGTTDDTAEQGAEDMMTFLDSVYEEFRKPVWLTEFNCGDGAPKFNPLANQTAANHLRFMRAALPKLEAAEHVERYSWFQVWQKNTPTHPGANPGCALVTEEGEMLTELGEFYSSYEYGGKGSAIV